MEYSRIYFRHDEHGYLNLVFINSTERSLLFDGLNFYYLSNIDGFMNFKELEYSKENPNRNFVIDALKQSGDVTYIKLRNGDIFQIYFLPDDNESNQHLSIFSITKHKNVKTPLGPSLYDEVNSSLEEADDIEIGEEDNH